jgi:hypothetical protein
MKQISPHDITRLRRLRHDGLRRVGHLRDMLARGLNTGEDVFTNAVFLDQVRQYETIRKQIQDLMKKYHDPS